MVPTWPPAKNHPLIEISSCLGRPQASRPHPWILPIVDCDFVTVGSLFAAHDQLSYSVKAVLVVPYGPRHTKLLGDEVERLPHWGTAFTDIKCEKFRA